jgi:two-component system sensor histidine kinase KdpD
MDRRRPDPDELLARVELDAEKQRRGRLKVFFGASPGVGKTYAMLQAARLQKSGGVDVVAGYVETHRRADTEALLESMEILPRRKTMYRGIAVEEFDLDRALARRPTLILVDELAHTNAPGSRHRKRWQDVFELLDAGIHVYTTLNIQHLDSLNDVVAQITGVVVRETVPDSVLDQADDIELIDLPVDELLKRLEEGKVYVPDQASVAVRNFFRPGNLIALRQLALRRTAERVDAQMREYRREHAIEPMWPTTERLLACIGPSPFSAHLIRATRRLAARFNAEWIVAFVETPDYASQPHEVHERVFASLRLAEQLGAETATLSGTRVSETVLQYARSRNVTGIVVGKYVGPWWKRLLKSSIVDELMEHSGDIQIHAIRGEPEAPRPVNLQLRRPTWKWNEYPASALIVLACTLISLVLRPMLTPVNLVMVYLLGVVAVASRYSKAAALFASLVSVASFDFFCVPPYYTFAVSDYEYVVTFSVMLAVALIISHLTLRIRMQASSAVDREARTAALYRLTREMSGQTRSFEAARTAARIASEVFRSQAVLFLADDERKISFRRRTSETLSIPHDEEGVAQWVCDHNQKAGKGSDTLPGASALYVPLKGSQDVLGVLALVPENDFELSSPEHMHLLDMFAAQIALVLERARAAAAVRAAAVRVEAEQTRSSLLSSVSHDLRTPLASITGAATSLLEESERLDRATTRELLESIADEAERMSRLIGNLLQMTRLDTGDVQLQKDWHPIEEILGAALRRTDRVLRDRPMRIQIEPDLPMACVDDVLIEQVFVNLLENAAKYTPPGAPVEFVAWSERDRLLMEVRDNGPGFPPGDEERVFERFYRGKSDGVRGAGLGLPICRAILTAHHGAISAANRPEGGGLIRISLPTGGVPPVVHADADEAAGD